MVIILCLRALQCEKLYINEERHHENRMWCYLHSYYGEKNRMILPLYDNSIKRLELINRLIKIDEIITEYNCKDDEENIEREEFLFLYHKIIKKYMV
jgi:hypothetical protein